MIQCSDISIAFQGRIVLDRIALAIPDGALPLATRMET